MPALNNISFIHLLKDSEEIGLLGFMYDSNKLLGFDASLGHKGRVRFSYSLRQSTTQSLELFGKLA